MDTTPVTADGIAVCTSTVPVDIRAARPADASTIARMILMAGGGVYEFLLDGVRAGADAVTLLVPAIVAETGANSYRNALVAVAGRHIVGLAHAYPAAWMMPTERSMLPRERLEHLAAFDTTQDAGSYFLSALAVDPAFRRQGIAGRLIGQIEDRARKAGFDRVTLHVWCDNRPARALYTRLGYENAAVAAIPRHPRLPHEGGSVLMRKFLGNGAV